MPALNNQLFAILFVALATAATFLIYYLRAYPFDKEKKRSEGAAAVAESPTAARLPVPADLSLR